MRVDGPDTRQAGDNRVGLGVNLSNEEAGKFSLYCPCVILLLLLAPSPLDNSMSECIY